MTEGLVRTAALLRVIARRRTARRVFLASGIAYLLLYLLAIGDLSLHGWRDGVALRFGDRPLDLLFRPITAFYFEAIGILRLPVLTLLVSPLNLLIGLLLSLLVGLNLAYSYLAIAFPEACRGRPALSALSPLPGLLAGSACCGPIVLIVLGIQVSASVIAVFGWMVPIAAAFLIGTLVLNAKRTHVERLLAPG